MIRSGEKPEEYRNITPYWCKRLLGIEYALFSYRNNYQSCNVKGYTHAHFTLGYPRQDDADSHMVKKIKEIMIGTGKPEWGAEPGVEYFVIKLSNESV